MADRTKYFIEIHCEYVDWRYTVRGKARFWTEVAFLHNLLGDPSPGDMNADPPDGLAGRCFMLDRAQAKAYAEFRRNLSRAERGYPPVP